MGYAKYMHAHGNLFPQWITQGWKWLARINVCFRGSANESKLTYTFYTNQGLQKIIIKCLEHIHQF